jgi:aminoglycoside phosphotransferase
VSNEAYPYLFLLYLLTKTVLFLGFFNMMLLEKSTVIQNLKDQHEGTESLAIKNTFIRICTLIALKTTARLFKHNGACIPISKNLIVKTGPYVHLAEAATMRFVADNTSLPVPKVFCSFLHKDRAYIIMERIQGEAIPTAWKNRSEKSREKIFGQLKTLFQELRALKPADGTSVESCVGGTVREARIPRPLPRMGPFKTIQEFHLFLRDNLRPEEAKDKKDDEDWQGIVEMAAKQDGLWPAPVFTHGDLNPFNILVRGDEVAAIIDWECAGWFPNYWEYTSAWYGNLTRTEWQENLSKFLDAFPAELEMEKVRNKWWGEW